MMSKVNFIHWILYIFNSRELVFPNKTHCGLDVCIKGTAVKKKIRNYSIQNFKTDNSKRGTTINQAAKIDIL